MKKFLKKPNRCAAGINQGGYTLLEIVVSVTLFVIVIILVNDLYLMSQRAYNKNADTAELTQNARVSLDRLSRELRQSAAIVTTLPPTDTDPSNPPPSQILFQDGHDISRITYLRYYLQNGSLKRELKAFYFEGENNIYVYHNSVDAGGSPPQEDILYDQVVGEYYNDLKFWGADGLINISLSLVKNQHKLDMLTSIFSRNY